MRSLWIGTLVAVFMLPFFGEAQTLGRDRLGVVFSCEEENDLYRAVCNAGENWLRFDTPEKAIQYAPEKSGVAILAQGYPQETTVVKAALLDLAAVKQLRVYIEYPTEVLGLRVGVPQAAHWERAVVTSPFFGPTLGKDRILAIHDCHFVPIHSGYTHLVLAQVAGFDNAVFGVPAQTNPSLPDCKAFPILFKHPLGNVMVATTKLSQFISARYGPTEDWRIVWQTLMGWLNGEPIQPLKWLPTVRPAFGRDEALPPDAELDALKRGTQWYFNAKMLIHPEWKDKIELQELDTNRVGGGPKVDWTAGDGKLGMLEGFCSRIFYDGRQGVRYWRRNDCMSESAMALAFGGTIGADEKSREAAANLNDFIYSVSELAKGPRANPESPSFGLVGWNVETSPGVYYGDDNARSMLGTIATSALLKTDKWDEGLARCLLANLRTTGTKGFRENSLTEEGLQAKGWRNYFNAETVSMAPHYQAYLWACFLWAYGQTGYAPFLERTKTAIRMTMDGYPDQWAWTNGMQQERARMLLPLAWLVRIEDTPEHRQWLKRMADDLLKLQDASGAIQEELGPEGKGTIPPPKSNEEYGTKEAPLIQQNGDPACDLLYTTNFAFLGLHEAAAATGDAAYAAAEDKLAAFLCRIQVCSDVRAEIERAAKAGIPRQAQHELEAFFSIPSDARPEFDGAWFRGFDFKRWEYWASNGDAGWGAWSIETGWTQGWITSVLGLRQMKTSFWELTAGSQLKKQIDQLAPTMLSKETPNAKNEAAPPSAG